MNQDQTEKLNDIHSDVRKSRTRIEVIDERTRAMDSRMDSMREDISDNSNDIDNLQSKVGRNSTILGGLATLGSGIILWLSDKVSRVI